MPVSDQSRASQSPSSRSELTMSIANLAARSMSVLPSPFELVDASSGAVVAAALAEAGVDGDKHRIRLSQPTGGPDEPLQVARLALDLAAMAAASSGVEAGLGCADDGRSTFVIATCTSAGRNWRELPLLPNEPALTVAAALWWANSVVTSASVQSA